jgi:hypothetical protein
MSDTPWTDEYTLLCEQCGYVVEGLDTSNPCPECGKPIEESLPIERPGTPWQQRHSIINLIRTWYLVVRRPKQIYDDMNWIEQDGISLTAIGLCFALIAFTASGLSVGSLNSPAMALIIGFMIMVVMGLIYWVFAYVYAWFATARIQKMTQNKYRIDSHGAWAVVGHASIGLCLPPLAVCVLYLLNLMAWVAEAITSINMHDFLDPVSGLMRLIFLASFPAGLILFETLCTIGTRRCKFRNRLNPNASDLPEPRQIETRTT